MDRQPAIALVSRIEATWSDGRAWPQSRIDAWLEALESLDEGAAGTAFARLRSSHPTCPTVPLFIQTCKAISTTHRDPLHRDCGWCDDTGWVETAPHESAGTVYSGVKPCPNCGEGRARASSETWTQSKPRRFVSDAEAARLIAAEQRRHNPPKETAA